MLSSNFVDNLGGGVPLEMITIPGGTFEMGSNDIKSEKPIHQVNIKPFYLGKYTITQEQYQAVMGINPSYFKGAKYSVEGGVKRPVEGITWRNAVEFCKRLSQETDKNYRLPSEAEWEYACRAGTKTKYHFGDDENQLENYAWYCMSFLDTIAGTRPVGRKQPNQFGLYDMYGNVLEWCNDRYHLNYNNAPIDGSSWEIGAVGYSRQQRGGYWHSLAVDCRSADRSRRYSALLMGVNGFRVALNFA